MKKEGTQAVTFLAREAASMKERLTHLKPFALHMPQVPAAAISLKALKHIESHLKQSQGKLQKRIDSFLKWLPNAASPAGAQRRLNGLRLHFNMVLTHFDIYSDALTQRGEAEDGVWLAGLDAAARDALNLPGSAFPVPPLITYLDRGGGAAIRRAGTRLPGGGTNPVAVIRIPRERMVGSGIAASLIHEVGHQAAALLDLVASLRAELQAHSPDDAKDKAAWNVWSSWASEILADFWAVAHLGITATQGLMAVASLPRPYVFNFNPEDPHPTPWLRVKISAAMGHALFPHPQWQRLLGVWEAFYPNTYMNPEQRRFFAKIENTIPKFVSLLTRFKPPLLKGQSLPEVLHTRCRQPQRLETLWRTCSRVPGRLHQLPPTLALAVIGQGRALESLSATRETQLVSGLLKHWALMRLLQSGPNKQSCCSKRNHER